MSCASDRLKCALALCVALQWPELARALPDSPDEAEAEHVAIPEPPILVAERVPDGRALVGGAVLFAVGYVPAFATSAHYGYEDGSGWLLVPVAGPFAAIGADAPIEPWAFALDGVVQTLGAGLMVGAFVFPRRAYRNVTVGPLSIPQRRASLSGIRVTYVF